MRQADFVSGVVLGLLALVILLIVIPQQIEQAPQGFMSPRLVPSMMMIAVIGLSVLLVLKSLRGASYQNAITGRLFTLHELWVVLCLAAVFAAAIMLFLWVSPLAAGIVLIVGTLLALGERRPLVILIMPTALLFAVWVLFYHVLGTAIL